MNESWITHDWAWWKWYGGRDGDCTGSVLGWSPRSSLSATLVLCFAFVTKSELVTQQCFHYCWVVLAQHQGLLYFSLKRNARDVGKEIQLGQLTQIDQKYIPFHIKSCSAIKAQEKEEEEGRLLLLHLSSQELLPVMKPSFIRCG